MRILLSVISTNHSALKQHWEKSRQEIACPVTVLGSYQKPQQGQEGLVCLLDDMGRVQKSVSFMTPAGLVRSETGLLVASHSTIHEIAVDLSVVRKDVVSLPLFNTLHSLSRTRHGYLVASTGLDALVEFDQDGRLLWNWLAVDHGFEETPTGEHRVIDPTADHRTIRYGTLQQTTHINSAAELPDGRILATLFHQGRVIVIDRESGAWQPVLDGLDHPHAVRVVGPDYFTVADTGRGRAILARINEGKGYIEAVVETGTSWLQDCQYHDRQDCWVCVDGKNARVILRRGLSGEKTLAQLDLDPEWRLYEALVY